MRMIFRCWRKISLQAIRFTLSVTLKVDHGWLNQREHLISYTVITRKKSDCLASTSGLALAITTFAPAATRLDSCAAARVVSTISSVEPNSGMKIGLTPQVNISRLTVSSLGLAAIIGVDGLCLATSLAVRPVLVQHIIAEAPASQASRQAA